MLHVRLVRWRTARLVVQGHVQLRQKFGRGFQQVLVVGLNFSLVQSPRLSYSRASVHPFRPTVGELENTDPLASDLACARLRGECGVALAGGHRLESVKEVGGPCFVDAQQIQVQDTTMGKVGASAYEEVVRGRDDLEQ